MIVKLGVSHQGRNIDCWRLGEEHKISEVAGSWRKFTAANGSVVEFYSLPKYIWMTYQGGWNRLGMLHTWKRRECIKRVIGQP
jgi:hypothetical protein